MYEKLEASKNNFLVPTVGNSWLHSKYDPIKEAEVFADVTLRDSSSFRFIVVLGIAGGYHIASLLEKKSDLKILAIEDSDETIDFLRRIPLVSELEKKENVAFSSIDNFSKSLKEKYLPAVDGNLALVHLRSWKNIFGETSKYAEEIFKTAVEEISADFSVQAHFGKLWQKNIFENLKEIDFSFSVNVDSSKTAAIISAGPSLDEAIERLKNEREKYVIFATDTAFSALNSHGVKSDFVISIDAQNISRRHFIKEIPSDTIFVFDLCANPAAVKKAKKNGNKIIFVQTGHPLSQIATSLCPKIMRIDSGSGTVTIAAVSFASRLGFKKFDFFANDFAYINGKPYSKGTYLDSINSISSSRISTGETFFAKIMFRSPLIPCDDKDGFTTKILLGYKNSLDLWLSSLEKNPLNQKTFSPIINEREFQKFDVKEFVMVLENLIEKGENVFLLPLAASEKNIEAALELTKKYMKFL